MDNQTIKAELKKLYEKAQDDTSLNPDDKYLMALQCLDRIIEMNRITG